MGLAQAINHALLQIKNCREFDMIPPLSRQRAYHSLTGSSLYLWTYTANAATLNDVKRCELVGMVCLAKMSAWLTPTILSFSQFNWGFPLSLSQLFLLLFQFSWTFSLSSNQRITFFLLLVGFFMPSHTNLFLIFLP